MLHWVLRDGMWWAKHDGGNKDCDWQESQYRSRLLGGQIREIGLFESAASTIADTPNFI